MEHQDWDPVVLRKANPKASDGRTKEAIAAAIRSGAGIETAKKYGGGGNRQHGTGLDTAKLDRETEQLKHNHVPATVAQTIQKARQAKGLTQKELATQINEKPQIVTEYEQGKAIPNNAILGKLERVLGVKLRGKDIGAPLAPKVPAAKAPAKPAGKKV